MGDAGSMLEGVGAARLLVGGSYLLISAALAIVNKKTFSFSGFSQVVLLTTVQELSAIASTIALHGVGVIRLRPIDRPSWSFASVVLCFVCYVLTSLYGQKFVSVPLYTTLRKLGILSKTRSVLKESGFFSFVLAHFSHV